MNGYRSITLPGHINPGHIKDFVRDFGGVGDGLTDNHAAFASLFNSVGASGVIVHLPAGNYLINFGSAFTQAVANVWFMGTPGVTTITLVAPTWQTTGLLTAFANCLFTDVIFNGNLAHVQYVFTGEGCHDLIFERCGLVDMQPDFCMETGPNQKWIDCFSGVSSSPPAVIRGTIGDCDGGLLLVERCNFQAAPSAGASQTIVSASIGTNSQMKFPNMFICRDNRFLDTNLPGQTCDAAIDIEVYGTVPIDSVLIEGNTIFNSNIYLAGVTSTRIKNNRFRITANGTQVISPINGFTVNTAVPAMDRVEVEDNDIIFDDGAGMPGNCRPLRIQNNVPINVLKINNNRIQANGATSSNVYPYTAPIIVESVHATIDHLEIEGNDLSYSSVPTTVESAIIMRIHGTNTINYAKISKNRLMTDQACSYLIQEQNDGTAGIIDELIITENDTKEFSPTIGLENASDTIHHTRYTDNTPYNPRGLISPQPAMSANNNPFTNSYHVPCLVTVTGGTVTSIAINGTATGLTSGSFILSSGNTITIVYSVVPTWVWFGM